MDDVTLLRIGILIAGAVLIGAIVFFGRPRKPGQGKRVARDDRDTGSERREPTLGEQLEGEIGDDAPMAGEATSQAELALFERTVEGGANGDRGELGRRESDQYDQIITVYLAARAGAQLHGPEIVVAAEKAGLVYGHLGVFHRLVESHPERGPVFSVANIQKPGNFDMSQIQSLQTPAIAFFLTLPAPVAALDAWDAMLPAAQRMAELLDGLLLDEQRSNLGRPQVARIRDELRAYDRQREAPPLTQPNRW